MFWWKHAFATAGALVFATTVHAQEPTSLAVLDDEEEQEHSIVDVEEDEEEEDEIADEHSKWTDLNLLPHGATETATKCPHSQLVLLGENLLTVYDQRMRNASYVVERLQKCSEKCALPNELERNDRQKCKFCEDARVPEMFRALLVDYWQSGFDRGHLAPAGNFRAELGNAGQESMCSSFVLSNIAPQVGNGFNRHYWARFEKMARDVAERFDQVYIVTGPLYVPELDEATGKWCVRYEVIGNGGDGPPNVAVPTHFFKIIVGIDPTTVDEGASLDSRLWAAAFILPNTSIRADVEIGQFRVPIEAVEHLSGVRFFGDDTRRQFADLCQTDSSTCQLPEPEWWKKRVIESSSPNVAVE
jgi:endonuclease G, mitochondrial